MTANGLVQIGVLSGGGNPLYPRDAKDECTAHPSPVGDNPCGIGLYGDVSAWTPLALYLQWLAENNPLRVVTAAAGNLDWSNPAAWIDPFHDPAHPDGAVPNNTRGVVDINANEPARYYEVTLNQPGTITLDMDPQIDMLTIAGAQSQLVIGRHTLEVLLDTRLSAGTLTMLPGGILATGTYTQTGGLLQYMLASSGTGRIQVADTATLGGTLAAFVTPGLYGLSTRYSLLTAGEVKGQFAQFISSPPSAFLSLSGPSYSPTSVDVTLTRTPFGAVAGLSANQRAVGNALEGAYATTLTGPAATLYTNLLMTGTPNALSQLSGEGTTAAQNATFASGRMFDSLLMDQGAFWRSGETADSNGVTFREAPLAYAAEKKKPTPAAFKELKAPPPVYQPRTWRVWTGGFGGVQSFNGDASIGSADARTDAAGGAMGFDYQVDPTRLIGVAVGGSESHFSVPDRATSGDLVGGHVGAYGVASWGALYAAGVLSYSRFDNDVTRTIAGVGPSETATGRFATDLLGARLELGRSYALPWLNVTPFAAVQTSTLWQRGFTETSSAASLPGILGLTYQSQTTTSLPTFLGLQFDVRWALTNGMVWSPFLRAAWVHEFRPDRSITGSFVSVPGAVFGVDGARAWSDALKVNAGSRLAINQYASLFASFDGEFANSGHSYAGRGGIRFSW
jgi:outer membrane autotransporter protein